MNIRLRFKFQAIFISLVWLLGVDSVIAQNVNPAEVTLPQLIDRETVMYDAKNRDAIVRVRYTIKADGSTADFIVVDGFFDEQAEEVARQTVSQWRFNPATINGEAIDWLNNEYVFKFVISDTAAVSQPVAAAYPGIASNLTEGKFGRAINDIERLLGNALTIFDYAFLNDILSTALLGDSRIAEALASSKKATVEFGDAEGLVSIRESAGAVLTPELLEPALRKRFLLALNRSHNLDALATFDRLVFDFDIPVDDAIFNQVEVARGKVNSTEAMGLVAKLTEDTWSYTPARRIITATNSSGEIDTVQVRCKRRNATLEFAENVEWNLPPSWGKCVLDFVGKEGAEFTLYEFSE